MKKRFDSILNDRNGKPVSGINVAVRTVANHPNGALATIYSDEGITPAANPLTTDSLGYYEYYVADGDYSETIYGTGIATRYITDVTIEDGTTPVAGTFTTLNATGGGALTGTWTDLGSVTTVDINGGTVDGAVIGGTSRAAGNFTALDANSTLAVTDISTFSAALRAADGSAAAPSYSFANDTDTGRFRVTTNSMADVVGGQSQVLIETNVFRLRSTTEFGWSSGNPDGAATDAILVRDAANTVAQRNGANAQVFRVGPSTGYAIVGDAGLGYATGLGGTVTQTTNKATGVTLSKVTGEITMNAAALAADTTVSFVLTNTAVATGDYLLVQHVSAGTAGAYACTAVAAAGSATINVRNITAASLSEAIVLKFVLFKAVTA